MYERSPNMKEYHRTDYTKDFGLSSIKNAGLAKNALDQALKARENEIALFWKRSGFFWAFIVSAYTAYFFVEKDSGAQHHPYMSILLLGLAFLLCLLWHLVNKGSKFWQKNWEFHVNQLATQQIGPLFRVYRNPYSGSLWNPISEYDFSVSKICMAISFVMTLVSGWLFSYQLLKLLPQEFEIIRKCIGDLSQGLTIALSFGVAIVFFAVGILGARFILQGNKHERIDSAVVIEDELRF